MKPSITSLLENKRAFSKVMQESAKIVSKDSYEQGVYRQLMENTRSYLMESTGVMGMSDIEPVARVILPLIRKLFPRLIANKIVGVQPMTGPTGFVRFLHYYYNNTEVPSYEPSKPIPASLNDTYPNVSSEVVVASGSGTGLTGASYTYTTLVHPIARNTFQVQVGGVTVATDGQSSSASANYGTISGTFNNLPVNGTIDYITGQLNLTFTSPITSGTPNVSVIYGKDFMNVNGTAGNDVSDANFMVDNIPVFAEMRKLRASWLPGALNALQSIDGVDLEKTLFTQVSNIIATEINQEIVNDLISKTAPDAQDIFYTTPPSSPVFYGTRTEWYAQLIIKINEISAIIANKIQVGEPNYLVANPATAAILRSAFVDFKMSDAGVNNFGTLSFIDYGNLNGRFQLYVSPVVPPNIIFMGYKGPEAIDSGYVYAPWIPLRGQRYATNTGETGIVFYTAYGKVMYRNDFYGYITIDNHNTPPADWGIGFNKTSPNPSVGYIN